MRKKNANKHQIFFAFSLLICFPGDRFSEVREHLIVVLTGVFTSNLAFHLTD